MIDANALRSYRRHLLMACLHRAEGPLTAGDLLERMGDLSFGLGHDKEVLAGLSGSAVAGYLRELKGEGVVATPQTKYNAARGRDEPTWALVCVSLPDYPPPQEPSADAQAPPAPKDPPITRDEVLSFLEAVATAERAVQAMATELAGLRAWGRRMLAATAVA